MASSLMERARQGEVGAIAQVLQQALHEHGIWVTANLHQTCLRLALESSAEPDRTLVTLIEATMVRLNVESIHSAKIYALKFGDQKPVWVHELALNPRSPDELLRSGPSSDVTKDRPRPPSLAPGPIPVPHHPPRHRPQPQPGHQAPQQPLARPRQPAIAPPPPAASQDLAVIAWERFIKPLNPLKSCLLIMLAIHSIFGSSSYTLQGFMSGSDVVMVFLHGVNLIFHEAGHVFFLPFGRFLHILGGSLFQILVPASLCAYFVWTNQRYSGAIALWWVGQNFLDVSIYIRDAQERALPLLIDLPEAHDWHNLLLMMRLLPYDDAIANLAFVTGLLIYLVAIALGFYFAREPNVSFSSSSLD